MSSLGSSVVRRFFYALLVVVSVWASSADAQSPAEAGERAAARRLASEGFAQLEAGQPEAAEQSFTRALALFKAPTLYLARGRARLQLSWLVAASEDFRAAASFELTQDETSAFANARAEAALEWTKLEKRVPTLTVQLTGDAKELRVDGVLWPLETVGVARPYDPGRHLVEAVDYDGQVHSSSILLQESHASVVSLSLPSGVPSAEALAPAAVAAPAAVGGAGSAPAAALRADHAPIPTAAWVSGGVTVALVAAAVVTGVLALNKRAEFNDNNVATVSSETKRELRASAKTMAWINTAFVGGAVAGAGLTTYLLLAPRAPRSDRAELRPDGLSIAF